MVDIAQSVSLKPVEMPRILASRAVVLVKG
jgi:hypothetical protein